VLVLKDEVEAKNFERNKKEEKVIAKKKLEEIIHEKKLVVNSK